MTYLDRLPYDLKELSDYLSFELLGNLYANMIEFSVLTKRKRFCQILWRKHFLVDENIEDVPICDIVTRYWHIVNKLANAKTIEDLFCIASKHNLAKIVSLILARFRLVISDYDIDRIIFRNRLNMLKVILPHLNDITKVMIFMKALTFNRTQLTTYLYSESIRPNYELLNNTLKLRMKSISFV